MNLHFVRFIRGLQNFLAIPIMNTLAGFMIRRHCSVHKRVLTSFDPYRHKVPCNYVIYTLAINQQMCGLRIHDQLLFFMHLLLD